MRCSDRWLRFRLQERAGAFAKVPIQLNGRAASVTNPAHRGSFRAARNAEVGDGIGYVLGDGLGCIDLDHCITDGRIAPWAAEMIRKHERRAVLIETSVSGTGIHIFVPMRPGRGRRIRDGRNIEVYPPDSGRYIAVTGRRFSLTDRGYVVERELRPCGTPAAARRHRRRGEQVCDACRAAEADARAASRAAQRAQALADAAREAEVLPEKLSQHDELRFMYAKIRGALERAEPKEVATLVKQGDLILERIALLEGDAGVTHGAGPAQVDELDALRGTRGYQAAIAGA